MLITYSFLFSEIHNFYSHKIIAQKAFISKLPSQYNKFNTCSINIKKIKDSEKEHACNREKEQVW